MEIKFYTSFKEFADEYQNDLKRFYEVFPNGLETDFIHEIKPIYESFIQLIESENNENKSVLISFNNFINWKDNIQNKKMILQFDTKEFFSIFNKRQINEGNHNNFKIPESDLTKMVDYIDKIDEDNYLKENFIGFNFECFISTPTFEVDHYKFKDFEYSIKRIIEFLDEKELEAGKPITSFKPFKVKGSLQSFGYIISELIEKGYIVPPQRNNEFNKSKIAEMILEHFFFLDREDQPTKDDIRKTLFTDNRLSDDKRSRFKIPTMESINR